MSFHGWHVGMKVVCVDAAPVFSWSPLVLGETYTVSAITVGDGYYAGKVATRIIVAICEAQSYYLDGSRHPHFAADRFRPVQTRKTDISIFTAMLHGTDQKADA